MKQSKLKEIRPCGHHLDDGIVQICFTLPLECNEQSQRAAITYAEKMGISDCRVTWMEAIGPSFTYFIIYGKAEHYLDAIDLQQLTGDIPRLAGKTSDFDRECLQRLGRRIVIFACTDSVGCSEIEFEALISLKGISGEIGLEGYSTFILRRERGLEDLDAIVNASLRAKADVILICEPDGSRGKGEKALKELARKLNKSKELPEWVVLACWRRDPDQAGEAVTGYDLSFGRGSQPSLIADQIVTSLIRKGFTSEGGRLAEDKEVRTQKKRKLWGIFGRSKK